MRFRFLFKGALTNKPFAFFFRAWELETHQVFNFFDVFCEPLLVNVRGINIVRVLPVTKEILSFNWITDKVRFFFDSLKYQRKVDLSLHIDDKVCKRVIQLDWKFSFSFFGFLFLKLRSHRLNLLLNYYRQRSFRTFSFNTNVFFNLNFNTDLLDLFFANSLIKRIGGGFFLNNFKFNRNFCHDSSVFLNYFSSLKDFFLNSNFMNFLLISMEIRYEFPKLYLLLKNKKKQSNFKLFTLGARNLTLSVVPFISLGFSLSTFFRILSGNSLFNNYILKTKLENLAFLGDSFSTRLQRFKFESMLQRFSKCCNFKILAYSRNLCLLNQKFLNPRQSFLSFCGYNSFSNLNNFKGVFYDLSFSFKTNFYNYFPFLLYVNTNPFLESKMYSSTSISLPCLTFFERNFMHLDVFGCIKESYSFLKGLTSSLGFVQQKSLAHLFKLISNFFFSSVFSSRSDSCILKFLLAKPRLISSVLQLKKLKSFGWFGLHKVRLCFDHSFVYNYFKLDEFSKHSLVLNILSNFSLINNSNYLK